MNRTELETRLSGAYRARTDLVTAADLTEQPPDFEATTASVGTPRRATLLPLLAAAAVVIVVAGVVLLSHVIGSRKSSPPAHPSPKVWHGVDPGWTVALWAKSGTAKMATLYLIDPDGKRRSVATYRTAEHPLIADWSRDHTKVLIVFDTGAGSGRAESLDLRTGSRTTVTGTVVGGVNYFKYFSTDGSTLLRFAAHASFFDYEVIDATGRVVSVLPKQQPTDAPPRFPVRATVAGKQVTLIGGRRLVIDPDEGQVRTLSLPAGQSQCFPLKMWTAGSVLVDCDMKQAWAVPLDGSAPTPLATPATRHVKSDPLDIGEIDAWRVGGRVYVRQPASCLGFVELATVGSDKVPHPVAIPVTAPVLSGVGDSAFYFTTVPDGCNAGGFYSDNSALYRWVPTEKNPTLLLGGNVNGGTVLDAKTLGQD